MAAETPFRIHVLLLPHVGWPELRERARRLEALGFDALALPDHLADWTRPASPWFESTAVLAALAQATSTIRVGTGVAQFTLRNPVLLARQVLTLDHISGGRFDLGIGTGLVHDPSYAISGLPDWDAKERVDRFEEYIDLVTRLLAGGEVTFAGRFYQATGAILEPGAVQMPRPPVAIAALGPRMLRIAARFGDSWDSMSFQEDVGAQLAEMRQRTEQLAAACAEVGRDPATLGRSYLMFDTTARRRGGAIRYYDSVGAFEDEVGPLLELGIGEVGIYWPADPAQLPVFERIATDVLPRLRRVG